MRVRAGSQRGPSAAAVSRVCCSVTLSPLGVFCLRASASLLLWKVVCGGRESRDGACAHLILECPRLPADMKKDMTTASARSARGCTCRAARAPVDWRPRQRPAVAPWPDPHDRPPREQRRGEREVGGCERLSE